MEDNKEIESIDDFFDLVEKGEATDQSIQKRIQKEQELAKLELIRFTRGRMKKSEAVNGIVEKASQILMDRLNQDEVELGNISTGTLAYIIEKLSKVEVDLLGAMLSANKSSGPAINVNVGDKPKENDTPKEKEVTVDKATFESAKKVLDFLDKIETIKESGEFTEAEIVDATPE